MYNISHPDVSANPMGRAAGQPTVNQLSEWTQYFNANLAASGLSLRQTAKISGIDLSMLSRYKNGKTRLNLDVAAKLSPIWNRPVGEICEKNLMR